VLRSDLPSPTVAGFAKAGALLRRAGKERKMLGLLIFIVVLVVLVLWFVAVYNGLVRSRNQVDNAWSQIDVQLKRRHDLIPNLVEVVKDYMSYEKEVLENVTKARAAAAGATTVTDRAMAEGGLTAALGRLFAVMENYPQLKANQNVGQLQEELTSTENKIGFARQFYNDSVMSFNNRLQVIPNNIVASLANFKQRDLFTIPEAEKEVPKADLR
jgi:LemA protein